MSRKINSEFSPLPKWEIIESVIGFKNLLNLYPPYLAAGIQVESIDESFQYISVKMNLNFMNENYVGVHFGGSLYAMCDPFYMFILMKNLGKSYMVWDKAATIEFLLPGKGTVRADFQIPESEINDIKKIVAEKKKTNRIFECFIIDEDGNKVARITKTLYVRKL
jgi:acyl-coenzyme A thioesterase PaaI-like protein